MTPPAPPSRPKRSLFTSTGRRPHEGTVLLVGTGIAIVLGFLLLFVMT